MAAQEQVSYALIGGDGDDEEQRGYSGPPGASRTSPERQYSVASFYTARSHDDEIVIRESNVDEDNDNASFTIVFIVSIFGNFTCIWQGIPQQRTQMILYTCLRILVPFIECISKWKIHHTLSSILFERMLLFCVFVSYEMIVEIMTFDHHHNVTHKLLNIFTVFGSNMMDILTICQIYLQKWENKKQMTFSLFVQFFFAINISIFIVYNLLNVLLQINLQLQNELIHSMIVNLLAFALISTIKLDQNFSEHFIKSLKYLITMVWYCYEDGFWMSFSLMFAWPLFGAKHVLIAFICVENVVSSIIALVISAITRNEISQPIKAAQEEQETCNECDDDLLSQLKQAIFNIITFKFSNPKHQLIDFLFLSIIPALVLSTYDNDHDDDDYDGYMFRYKFSFFFCHIAYLCSSKSLSCVGYGLEIVFLSPVLLNSERRMLDFDYFAIILNGSLFVCLLFLVIFGLLAYCGYIHDLKHTMDSGCIWFFSLHFVFIGGIIDFLLGSRDPGFFDVCFYSACFVFLPMGFCIVFFAVQNRNKL